MPAKPPKAAEFLLVLLPFFIPSSRNCKKSVYKLLALYSFCMHIAGMADLLRDEARAKILHCLQRSRRIHDFNSCRRYLLYTMLAKGKSLKEANNMAWDAATKLYPDWADIDSTNKPEYKIPKYSDLAVKAASAGICVGNPNNPKHLKEYRRHIQYLKERARDKGETIDLPNDPQEDPWPNLDRNLELDGEPVETKLLGDDDLAPEANLLDDIYWVWRHLGDEPDENEAPSSGAHALHVWALDHQDDFYKNMATKVLPSRAQLDRELNRRDRGEASLEFIDRLFAIAEKREMEYV